MLERVGVVQVKNGKVRAHLSWRGREHHVCKGWRKLPTAAWWEGGAGTGRDGLEWQAEAGPSGPRSGLGCHAESNDGFTLLKGQFRFWGSGLEG